MEAIEEDLSLILWRERELLENLLYKLEIEQLVLASGRSRWLAAAAREVEGSSPSIRETELLRAVAADEAAAAIGLAANPSLRGAGRGGGRAVALDPRSTTARRSSRSPARSPRSPPPTASCSPPGYRAARETLLSPRRPTDGYAADRHRRRRATRHRLLDQSI